MPEGTKREALARDLREMESLIAVLLERESLRSRAQLTDTEDVDLQAVVAEVVATLAGQSPGVELVGNAWPPIRADRSGPPLFSSLRLIAP